MIGSAKHGICLRCKCPAGFAGRSCDKVKKFCEKRNVCQNGGSCISSERHGVCERCECPAGISGRYCEKTIDHCATSPCKNNGTCTSGSTTFSCQCAHGFMGEACEVIDHCAPSPCIHNGTCTSDSTTFSCDCPDGFSGNTCEVVDHCASSPCNNNGTCTIDTTTFSCQCAQGFLGSTCEVVDHCALSPCKNNGTCTFNTTTFSCQCTHGFLGSTCEAIDHCATSPCNNNGTCTSGSTAFSCQCAPGLKGDTCEDEVKWPKGTYTLVKPNTGCPSGWLEGWRYQDNENKDPNGNRISDGHHFFGIKGTAPKDLNTSYCTKDLSDTNTEGDWPSGNYCILMHGYRCPPVQAFKRGYVLWDDENDNNANQFGGVLPDGDYDDYDTAIDYCCRNDGWYNKTIQLPISKPFYLLRYSSPCQSVEGMNVREETIHTDDEDTHNSNVAHGSNPYAVTNERSEYTLHYCYYWSV